MALQHINPPSLSEPPGYTHVIVATGTARIYVAGQTGVDASGALVGPDHASQALQAFGNADTALTAAGAGWADVVRVNLLVWTMGRTPLRRSSQRSARWSETGRTRRTPRCTA